MWRYLRCLGSSYNPKWCYYPSPVSLYCVLSHRQVVYSGSDRKLKKTKVAALNSDWQENLCMESPHSFWAGHLHLRWCMKPHLISCFIESSVSELLRYEGWHDFWIRFNFQVTACRASLGVLAPVRARVSSQRCFLSWLTMSNWDGSKAEMQSTAVKKTNARSPTQTWEIVSLWCSSVSGSYTSSHMTDYI